MLPLGSRSVVHARVVSVDGRKVKTEGAISDQSGNVIADGTALFLTLDPTKFGQLASEASARLKREDSAI
jgi:predicted thioesterase